MEDEINFGDISELPLNRFFKTEDQHFTPWLRENIDKLGSAIGIDIAEAEIEVSIGNYRLDILAYESGTNRKITIENQYGKTDHSHLGQLITYMAGLNSEVVVWIAEKFNEEHITAINHLNQISNEDIGFFCIKPRLIKIDDSKPAIEFVTIAKPDEWEKQVKGEINISDRGLAYKEFWTKVVEKYQRKVPNFKPRKIPIRYSYDIPAGKTGLNFNWRFTKEGYFELGMWIGTRSKKRNHEMINEIISQKSFIEKKLGHKLVFFNDENFKSTSVNVRFFKPVDVLNLTEEERDELINWIIEFMPKFRKLLEPIIKNFK